jgi:WD40 repeat protein
MSYSRWIHLALALLVSATFSSSALAEDEAIQIPTIEHDGPVDFEKEILPILRKNCLACHNSTDAESDLVLENPLLIIKGGAEGPAVVPGKSAESVLLLLASRQRESFMPPDDNDVGAKQLTPAQLGLIKLWIDQGATGEVTGSAGPVQWQPLPAGVQPIYAAAISDDGQLAAAGRANQIFLYHVPTGRQLGRLTDPELIDSGDAQRPGVAFRDLVQSVVLNRTGDMIAAGGYRNVKVWKRVQNGRVADLPGLEEVASSLALSADGTLAAVGLANGKVQLIDLAERKVVRSLEGHVGPVRGLAFSADAATLFSGAEDKTIRSWKVDDGSQLAMVETTAPINALALVNQGKELAAGHADNGLRIWALPGAAAVEEEGAEDEEEEEGVKPLRELAGHGGPIHGLVVSGENQEILFSASQDGTVRHWTAADGKQVRQLAHGGPVTALAISSDGTRLISTSDNNSIKLWNTADGAMVVEIKGDFQKQFVAQRQQRDKALAAKRVELAKKDLEEANKRKTAEEENHKKVTEALTKAEEDLTAKTEVATKATADKGTADKAQIDAKTGLATAEEAKKTADEALVKADADLKTGQEAVVKAEEALVAATKAAEEAVKNKAEADKAASDNADDEDLKKAAEEAGKAAEAAEKARVDAQTAVDDAKKKVEELTTAQKTAAEAKKKGDEDLTKATADLKTADENAKKATEAATKAVDEKDASTRATAAAKRTVERAGTAVKKATDEITAIDAVVKLEEADAVTVTTASEAADKIATESENPRRSAAFSADGTTFVVGGDGQLVTSYDATSGQPLDNYSGQASQVQALAFTADGHVLSIGENKSVILWDLSHRWELAYRLGSSENADMFVDRVIALNFSQDGTLLVAGSGEPSRSGQIKIFDTTSGELVRELDEPHSDTVFSVAFSRDGNYLASSAADRFVKVFQVADGAFVRSFEGHTHHVLGVSWSADGRTLASSGADNVVKVWSVKTGDQQRTIAGFGKEVTSITFVADGVNILASSGDKNVHVKRTDNGGNVRVLSGGSDFMYAVGSSGDGKVFVAGGQDSVLRIWAEDGKVLGTFAAPEPPTEEEGGGGEE